MKSSCSASLPQAVARLSWERSRAAGPGPLTAAEEVQVSIDMVGGIQALVDTGVGRDGAAGQRGREVGEGEAEGGRVAKQARGQGDADVHSSAGVARWAEVRGVGRGGGGGGVWGTDVWHGKRGCRC